MSHGKTAAFHLSKNNYFFVQTVEVSIYNIHLLKHVWFSFISAVGVEKDSITTGHSVLFGVFFPGGLSKWKLPISFWSSKSEIEVLHWRVRGLHGTRMGGGHELEIVAAIDLKDTGYAVANLPLGNQWEGESNDALDV